MRRYDRLSRPGIRREVRFPVNGGPDDDRTVGAAGESVFSVRREGHRGDFLGVARESHAFFSALKFPEFRRIVAAAGNSSRLASGEKATEVTAAV